LNYLETGYFKQSTAIFDILTFYIDFYNYINYLDVNLILKFIKTRKYNDVEYDNVIKLCLNIYCNKCNITYKLSEDRFSNVVRNGNIKLVSYLLKNNYNINVKENGGTALHIAVYKKNIEMAILLIDNGIDIDIINNMYETPLCLAIRENDIEMAQLLILRGSNVYFINNKGKNLLHIAIYYNSINILKFLLENFNIDINMLDKDKMTPLDYAIYYNRYEHIKLLLECNADINLVKTKKINNNIKSILHKYK
jgi:ankyrin repeat protein